MNELKNILSEKGKVSLEQWHESIILLDNISSESLGGFLTEFSAKAKDMAIRTLPSTAERSYRDAVRRSNLVKAKMRELSNVDLAQITFIVPESFSGNFNLLTEELIVSYESIVEGVKELMYGINRDIATNINNSADGNILPPTSFIKAKNQRQRRETFQKKIGGMFNHTKPRSFSKAIDHFRSTEEVVYIYDKLASLERTLGKTTIDEVIKLSEKLTKEINTYIDVVRGIGVNRKSDRAFKEFTECVYEAAKSLEFIGYLQAVSLQLYKSIQDFGEKVNKYKKV